MNVPVTGQKLPSRQCPVSTVAPHFVGLSFVNEREAPGSIRVSLAHAAPPVSELKINGV